MIAPLGISAIATFALVLGLLIGLAFVGGLIAVTIRRRGAGSPDIPPGMRPGPADEVLERRHVDRALAWGIVFVAIMAVWLPILWIVEPGTNVADARDLIEQSAERGHMWYEVASGEHPTGFGCARCHGEEAEGGSVPFTTPTGESVPNYAVPPLIDVCGGAKYGHAQITTFEDIRDTIMQGREGTPMPSWSVRFAGPMNDHQIQDLLNYITSINEEHVPREDNLCTNPQAGQAEEPVPAPSASAPVGAPVEEEPGGQTSEQPTPEGSPEEGNG